MLQEISPWDLGDIAVPLGCKENGQKRFKQLEPSFQYLELYAVAAGVIAWIHRFANKCIVLFSDNEAVVSMLNTTSSNCKQCMILMRKIVLYSLIYNVRVFAKHVSSQNNTIADSLLRFQMNRFHQLTTEKQMEPNPTPIPEEIWPIEKIWNKF